MQGGESLPLSPKQVAPRSAPASRAASLRFVACPPPLLAVAQTPPPIIPHKFPKEA